MALAIVPHIRDAKTLVVVATAATPGQSRSCLRYRVRSLLPVVLGLVCFLRFESAPSHAAFLSTPRRAAHLPMARNRLTRRAANGFEVDGMVEPLGSSVLVKIKEEEEFSAGGILLPKKQEQARGGEVVAVGPGEKDSTTGQLRPMELKPGVKVVYGKYAGATTLKCNGVEHAIVRQDDVLYSYEGEEATLDGLTAPRGVVLVKLEEAKTETKEGLLLSQGAVKASTTVGEVVKTGLGEMLATGETIDMPLEVGDMVRFRYGDEVELDIGEDRFSAVKVSNCIAKWKAS